MDSYYNTNKIFKERHTYNQKQLHAAEMAN